MVASAEKASLLGSQFDSKQSREQFVTTLSCFPQSRCNSLVQEEEWCNHNHFNNGAINWCILQILTKLRL